MSNDISIRQFIQFIVRLPLHEEQGRWIRWLRGYHRPGYHGRQVDKRRNARYVYNHLASPEMLLWLIQAAGVSRNLIGRARSDSADFTNPHQQCAVIRKHIPWNVLKSALEKSPKESPTHWLQYWKPSQIKPAISEPWVLNHSASNQLARVSRGDIVWIVSVEPPGRLITLGPIQVENVVGQREAEALFGSEQWPADWHAINTRGNAWIAEYVDLSSITKDLRFVSKAFPRLVLKQGNVSGTQFQQMRKLQPESAELISELWHTAPPAEIPAQRITKELEDLGVLDEKRAALVRREQGILRRTLFRSASVWQCGICGCEYPISLLVAAHIKPRAECSDAERRDIHNLMPLCLLGCDSLFERGFIGVNNGRVVAGPNLEVTKDLNKSIKSVAGMRCQYWSLESKKFFEWRAKQHAHRK